MKWKIILAIAAALTIAAQLWHSLGKKTAAPTPAVAAALPERADPARAATIVLESSDGIECVRLTKTPRGWNVASLHDVPASREKVERFLRLLLRGEATRHPEEGGILASAAGLDGKQGVIIKLADAEGVSLPGMILGLRPEGTYDAAYARMIGDDRIFRLSGDLRGELGLWRNIPDAKPESGVWMERRIVSFDPKTLVGLDAVYPDHQIIFDRDEKGEWRLFGPAPGGSWSREELAAWLADLSGFAITGTVDPGTRTALGLDDPTHRLIFTLADGSDERIVLAPNRAGDGMWVESSLYPRRVYFLPAWRFALYFRRFAALFPDAVPTFDPDAAHSITLRRDDATVTLSRRRNEWRASGPYQTALSENADRLLHRLAAWHPEDYASLEEKPMRSRHAGPFLEIGLDDARIIRYRLGGWHPVFPWRYVLVNDSLLFSVDESGIGTMFPKISDIVVPERPDNGTPPPPTGEKSDRAEETEPAAPETKHRPTAGTPG